MNRVRARFVAVVCLAGLLAACGGERQPVHELTGSAFGTRFSIKLVAPPESLDEDALAAGVDGELDRIDRRMSTYREDSEVSRFNAYDGFHWFPVSGELCTLVAEALAHSAATDGAFDITVAPLVDLWGFGPAASRENLPDPGRIDSALAATGYAGLHADCARGALRKDVSALSIDLSAIAKGHAVDAVAALLDTAGLTDYLVEIGGEMRVRGRNGEGRRWAVAIEAPEREAHDVYEVLRVTDIAIATSGDYRNYFEHDGHWYSHTIDPRTGRPVTHSAASVTVLDRSAAAADAIATALLVMGPEAGMAFAEREGLAAKFLLREDGSIVARASNAFSVKVSGQ